MLSAALCSQLEQQCNSILAVNDSRMHNTPTTIKTHFHYHYSTTKTFTKATTLLAHTA